MVEAASGELGSLQFEFDVLSTGPNVCVCAVTAQFLFRAKLFKQNLVTTAAKEKQVQRTNVVVVVCSKDNALYRQRDQMLVQKETSEMKARIVESEFRYDLLQKKFLPHSFQIGTPGLPTLKASININNIDSG